MKKIGILTFYKAINYGAVLQAYALQKKVADLGFDAELIDYASIGVTETAAAPIKKNPFKNFFNYILRPASNFRHLMRRIEILFIKRAEKFLFRKDLEKQNESFIAFKKKYLKISKNSYHTNKDLESIEPIYDGVITGSDQVWNPPITQSDLAYFLNFLRNNNKKISYAASFGSENIPNDFKSKIARELQNIKHLSVREVAGAGMIKNISNRNAQVVADPAFLLNADEWREIIPESEINEPYIFCYAFLGNPEIKPLCKHISKITGFKIIRLSLYQVGFQRTKEYFDRSTTYVNDSGPLEFLSYLSNASIVVTNSFHGAVFSINFRKNFFVISPEHSVERIINILDLYKLNDRLQKRGDKLPAKNDIEVDYSVIEHIFACERSKSIAFLKKALDSL